MLSVIIPVRNGENHLSRCLEALRNSTETSHEVIVIDDASTDASSEIALRFDIRIIKIIGGPRGPASARNLGAKFARGEILVFIDSDVLVHSETLRNIEKVFIRHPELSALFGSYDHNPPHRGIVSLYKNLQHHFVHHSSQGEASTFWAGCGAIRSDVFAELGGFDESYHRPSIEDIELGMRMYQAGYRIWLCPEVQVTHLKNWTLSKWLRSDILDRAVPWTQLIFTSSYLPSTLNLDLKSRISSLAAWLGVITFASGFWFPLFWIVTLLSVIIVVGLNLDLYRFLARQGGVLFMLSSLGLHTLYFLYSSLVFGILFSWYTLLKRSNRMGEFRLDRLGARSRYVWQTKIGKE